MKAEAASNAQRGRMRQGRELGIRNASVWGMVIERTVGGGLSPDLPNGLTAIGG